MGIGLVATAAAIIATAIGIRTKQLDGCRVPARVL